MNLSSLSRRSQAAVCATTPDQGRGDASGNLTSTVSPTLNWLTAPTGRHSCGALRRSGETRKAITGAPTIAAITALSAILILFRNWRRVRVSSVSSEPVACISVVLTFIPPIPDPPRDGHPKEQQPYARDDERGRDAPEYERHPERRDHRPIARPRQYFRLRPAPPRPQL